MSKYLLKFEKKCVKFLFKLTFRKIKKEYLKKTNNNAYCFADNFLFVFDKNIVLKNKPNKKKGFYI